MNRLARILLLPLAGLLLLPALGGEDDAETHYAAALAAEKDRDFRTAFAEYEKAMDLDSEYRDVVERYDACELLVQWQESLEGAVTAADLVRLGEVHARLERLEEERAAYEEALALDPDLPDAHGHLALFHYSSRARNRSMVTVIRETKRYLQTSPHRDRLGKALADFEVYGQWRVIRVIMHEEIAKSRAARKAGRLDEAAGIFEKAATRKDVPDVFRTVLLTRAGEIRREKKDAAGARADYEAALTHVACRETITSHLGLAALDVEAGNPAAALEHLRAAVKEGSGACTAIAEMGEVQLKPLFESPDEAVRAEMKILADPDRGDDPIRAEIEAACEKAGREGKLVLLHWYGPYCPFVMAMEERLAHPEVRKLIEEKFVHYRVDFGLHQKAVSLEEEYGNIMDEHGVPSFYVLTPDGTIHSIQTDLKLFGPARRSYRVKQIVEWLESVEP